MSWRSSQRVEASERLRGRLDPGLQRPVRPRGPSRRRSSGRTAAVRSDAVLAHQLAQHAFPQAPVGDPEPLRRKLRPDRLEDGAAGQNQIRPLSARCRGWRRARRSSSRQAADTRRPPRPGRPQAVDRPAIVSRQVEVDAGDGRHRSGRAEQVKAVAARLARRPWRRRASAPRRRKPIILGEVRSVTSTPPNISASDTTPSRMNSQARHAPPARALVGERAREISDEPPPMSNITIAFGVAVGEVPPHPARRQMGLRLAVDDLQRERRHARAPNRRIPGRSAAERQASVAIVRARVTLRAAILSRQMRQRRDVRSIAGLAQPPGQTTGPRRAGRCARRRRSPGNRRRSAARPEGGSCWCRGRAPRRSPAHGRRTAPASNSPCAPARTAGTDGITSDKTKSLGKPGRG